MTSAKLETSLWSDENSKKSAKNCQKYFLNNFCVQKPNQIKCASMDQNTFFLRWEPFYYSCFKIFGSHSTGVSPKLF